MVKENQKLFNAINIISDAVMAVFSMIASYLLVFHLLDFEQNYALQDYIKLAILFMPIQLMTFGCMGLYDSFRTKRFTKELEKLAGAFAIDAVLIITMLYVVHIFNFSRWALFIFFSIDLSMVTIKRFILRRMLKRYRNSGFNLKTVALIGEGEAAREYIKTIQKEKELGYHLAGYISDEEIAGTEQLGFYDDMLSVLETNNFDEVVCAIGSNNKLLAAAVEACEKTGTKISVIPSIYKYMSSTPSVDMVGSIPLLNIRRIPLDNIGNAFIKRAMDIVGSLVLIILTSPVMLISALVIKITMGGKVIFKQQRVGLNKKIFTMYKLKSMKDNASSDTAWSTDNDPRKTRFGSLIRKFSIDELPQLFNVLKGEMSLVGPRPEIPFYVNSFKETIPLYMIKHQVKPGMTGLAQINGYRGDTSIEKRIEYDIQYIENWNLFMDISILLRTALSGFINKEKIKKKTTNNSEKYSMNNHKKTDKLAVALFAPALIALAFIPTIMQATLVFSDLPQSQSLFSGILNEETGIFQMIDTYSQGKAFATVFIAMIMLGMALLCCVYYFRKIEKRSLIYVGASAVFVIMALISAMCSDYKDIAFNGVADRAEGFYTTACYFVLFLFTMYAFRKTQNFGFVALALFVCVGINGIIGIFQYTGHNLVFEDWFSALVIDPTYRDQIQLNAEQITGSLYGALYHYNYVGSFCGLIVPLFTVMAIFSEKLWQKLVFAAFDVLALFMLLASSARSGVVAIIAAAVVALIVFGRLLISKWKLTLAIAGSAAVLLVGANFALNNALFKRIPSLFEDVVVMVTPADKDADLFSELPVREIKHNKNGSVTFVTQEDAITISFDDSELDYTFTDNAGNDVMFYEDENGDSHFDDTRFSGISFELTQLDPEIEMPYNDMLILWFDSNPNSKLVFLLYNEKQIHLIDTKTGERLVPENAEAIGFEGKERLGSSRGYIWSRTIPLLKECILIGYGADTYAYVFPQNDILAKHYAYGEGFFITVDKPHNLYIQLFFSHGLIALIAFLAICVFYLVDCMRLYALKKSYRIEQIYGISIMLGVVGYLAAGLFNDSVVSVAPVFWILLGVGAALNTINRRMDRSPEEAEIDEPELVTAVDTQIRSAEKDEKLEQDAADLLAKINAQREEKRAKKTTVVTRSDLEALRASISEIKAKAAASEKNSDDE